MQSFARTVARQLYKAPTLPTLRLSAVQSHLAPKILYRTMASSEIPKTMSGVVINKTGGTEVLEYKTDLPVPQPKEGQDLHQELISRLNC